MEEDKNNQKEDKQVTLKESVYLALLEEVKKSKENGL